LLALLQYVYVSGLVADTAQGLTPSRVTGC
jgi:hypothetical protein